MASINSTNLADSVDRSSDSNLGAFVKAMVKGPEKPPPIKPSPVAEPYLPKSLSLARQISKRRPTYGLESNGVNEKAMKNRELALLEKSQTMY